MRRRVALALCAVALCAGAAVALSATPLKPPASLTAAAADQQVALSWPASSSGGVTGYRVYRRGANGRWPTAPLATTSSLGYTDTGLTNGTAYAYRVTTVADTRESKP